MSAPQPPTPRRTGMPWWWIASLVFHALVLGWLVYFSPIRVINQTTAAGKPTTTINPARAGKMLEQVREQQAKTLASEVHALEEVKRELAALDLRQREALRQNFTNRPVSLEQISAAQDQAAKSQAAAEANLKQANEQLPTITEDASALTNLTAGIRDAQAEANRSQGEALEALALADPKFEPAYQAQARANAAEARAAQAQAEAEGQLTGAATLQTRMQPAAQDLADAQQTLRAAEAQLTTALSNAVTLSNSLPSLQAAAAAAKTAHESAQAGGDKAQISAAKQAARDAQRAADTAQKNLTRALNDIPRFQTRVAEQSARVAKFSGKANPLAQGPEAMRRRAVEKFQQAQQLQQAALAAQKDAAKVFAAVRSGTSTTAPTAPSSDENLASLYKSAVQTEAELTEAYRRLRATDLAMQRQLPLARAMELTDAAHTPRPDLAAALSGSPANDADLAAQRQAVLDARSQIAAMRSLADSMLAQAHGLGGGSGRQQSLEQLAAEDENQRAKDLTGVMRSGTGKGSGTGSGNPGSGKGLAKSDTGSGGQGTGGSGNGAGSGVGSGMGNGPGSGAGSGAGLGSGGDGTSSGPPPVSKDLAAIPGRVIGANAVPGRWMFVDSWYLLGPFDNAGRVNIEKQFAPETVVDLNATYAGKNGTPTRWEFHQSAIPRIAPPFDGYNQLAGSGADGGGGAFHTRDLEYIIYYGYTEIRAAEDCVVWVAVGSDDFSKLWIEDQLVWASGKQQKKWRVDEGFRKVRLKQGVNRILIRVENGHGQSEFSLAVCAMGNE